MSRTRNALMTLALLALAACGDTTAERGLSGGAIGAGVGTAGAAVVGGSLATGAIVGGALGAATGILTDSSDIDLGRTRHR